VEIIMAFDPSTATEFDPSSAVEVTAGFDPSSAAEMPVVQPPKPGYKPTVFEETTGAVVEPLMKMGSGIIAKPVSDIAGLGSLVARVFGIDGQDPLTIKKNVQAAMTYEPRTALGKSEYNPLNAIPDVIGKGVSAATTPVMGALRGDSSADSARGMVANFVGEAVPQALGR